jgi:hypothetical protein
MIPGLEQIEGPGVLVRRGRGAELATGKPEQHAGLRAVQQINAIGASACRNSTGSKAGLVVFVASPTRTSTICSFLD